MKVNENTIIDKIFQGLDKNNWTVLNGLGSGNFNSKATRRTMVAPLLEYLEKNGIEVKRNGKKINDENF